ncbi:flagellar protein FlgN [Nocardioides pantholopis]|uniref:flagellar protein FlgN n=1 Tax=Nocardioides pantholopis TaxID=2483798 RepID=UPI000F089694|nr:flagellar protein FlgN [Nocardioides pantholopis]
MEKLSVILWRERELLDDLLFHLEVEQLVLASGRSKWLLKAAKDVEAVLDDMRRTEVLRSVAADEAAALVGLKPNPSLQQLVDAAEEPWRSILEDHRESLTATTREVVALADANRDLITNGYRSARETLMTLGGTTTTYGADGTAVTEADLPPSRIDRTL